MSQRSASPAPSARSSPPKPSGPDAPDALDPERVLRSHGLRVTRSRLAILSALSQGAHLDAEAVAAGARARLGTLSTQAVYDALHAFTRAGVVRRIEPAGHPARYETRVGDNHHHLVCRSCGAMADVDCAQGAAPCLDPDTTYGFAIEEAEVTFWGICPLCTASTSQTVTTEEHERTATHPHDPSRSPDSQQPAVAHGGQPRPGDPGELSVPGEDEPLRP